MMPSVRSSGCRMVVAALVWALVCGLGAVPLHGAESAGERPLNILFLYRTMKLDSQYAAELEEAGFSVEQWRLTDPIGPEELKAFNVVVMPDFLTFEAAFRVGAVDVPTWWDQNLPNLRAYVESGGGLLVATHFNQAGEALSASLERMLGPWGARFRAVQIIDPNHIADIENTGKSVKDKMFYCWTERIARHPATEGVKRIYYPVCNMRWDDCYTTPPIVLESKEWTPLVRAMAGACNGRLIQLQDQ